MTSPYERPDRPALAELEPLVQSLGEELAGWRRRALRAETDLQEALAQAPSPGDVPLTAGAADRMASLDQEASELRRRLAAARDQVELLRTRLRFLEERAEGAA